MSSSGQIGGGAAIGSPQAQTVENNPFGGMGTRIG